jgi:hypothetical protein
MEPMTIVFISGAQTRRHKNRYSFFTMLRSLVMTKAGTTKYIPAFSKIMPMPYANISPSELISTAHNVDLVVE